MDEQGNCLNWYTQPKVKKIMGPVDEAAKDLARHRTGLGLYTRWLYIGQSGSGKTQMVLSHLALTSECPKCAYDRVVICTAMTAPRFPQGDAQGQVQTLQPRRPCPTLTSSYPAPPRRATKCS
eukprot:gene15723-11252_t